MKLLEELEGNGPRAVRARLLACECNDETCDTVWVLAQVKQQPVFERREQLWLAMGFGEPGHMRGQAELLVADLEDDGVQPSELIERGVAVVGVQYRHLLNLQNAVAQMSAWRNMPSEVEGCPVEMAWRVRGICFGEPLTRVVAGCVALMRFYSPDGPVPPDLIVGV